MKTSWIAVLSAVLILVLTGCGGSPNPNPSPTPTPSPSTSAAPAPKVVPDVVGKTATDAVKAMNDALLKASLVGPDGVEWTGAPSSSAKVVSTDPKAGTTTTSEAVKLTLDTTEAAASAAEARASAAASLAAELAVRYKVTCESQAHTGEFDDFKSYKDVWKSADYQSSGNCFTDIDGQHPDSTTNIPLLPSEKAIVDIVASKGGGTMYPDDTFAAVYTLCATVPKDYPSTITASDYGDDVKAQIQGALALCPDAPHAPLLRQALNSQNYRDGSYTVGKTMDPGTYSTAPGVRGCYWSRTTGGGAIIANDFIDYAPDGATVTVYAGEGFTSTSCGVWTKTG